MRGTLPAFWANWGRVLTLASVLQSLSREKGPPNLHPRFCRRGQARPSASFPFQGLSDLGDVLPFPLPPSCGAGWTLACTYAYLPAFSVGRPVSIEGVSPLCSSCPPFGSARWTCLSALGSAFVEMGRGRRSIVLVGARMPLLSQLLFSSPCCAWFAFSPSKTCGRAL